ncbi:hypothetical protein DXG03_002667 [Asterophora parasitica]|uniref:BD-FAE-like domain-containing protein n=1 Tax=Asterophora parasitica TaxID=117018 RepID=A0A9P7GGN1_9AGAR|nr:hypothetical protein DXG03_002667 [Asterophora parasitica]
MELADIPYTAAAADRQRQLDVYAPPSAVHAVPRPPLVVFLHGGAWRAEDKAEHRQLALNLVAATGFAVAVPNYRLTPRDPPDDDHFRHPGHAEDALHALSFLVAWQGPSAAGPFYDPSRLYLIGHSCSAHMLSSIFLDSKAVSPSLTPPPELVQSVKGIVLSEGIYDLDLLLADFPDYLQWFIRPTFGTRESYTPFSTTTFPLIATHIKWLIIHSKGDTLVNLPQSEAIYRHLVDLNGNEASARVYRNTDNLSAEHNDIFLAQDYAHIVKEFILNCGAV